MTGFNWQRYTRCLNQQKWLSLTGFIVCVGISGAIAFRPWQTSLYQAQGVLLYEKPLDISTTATEVQAQIKQLPEAAILTEAVIQYTAEQTSISPQEIAQNTTFELPDPQAGGGIQVMYVGRDSEQARETLNLLMAGLVNHSQGIYLDLIRTKIDTIQEQIPGKEAQVEELKVELQNQTADNASNDPQLLLDLEKRLEYHQEKYAELLIFLDDTYTAMQLTGGVTIASSSVIAPNELSHANILSILSLGVLSGLGLGLIVIPLVSSTSRQFSQQPTTETAADS